jgi:hypothetical protein
MTKNWHHWAVTFDSTTCQRVIYEDGSPVASDTASPISISGATPAFLIGKSGSFFFDGSVDEVRVWNVVRTQTDIQNNMDSSSVDSPIGLLADWNFNEGTGATANDSSGNMHTATINVGATWALTVVNPTPTPPFLGFTITISGGIDLTIPDVPGAISITGSASFRVDVSAASLQLNVTGMADIDPLGNALDLEGVTHFDLGSEPFTNPQPEFYGIFVLQTGQLFNALSSYGLNVAGMAVLRFNTTSSNTPLDLPIPNADPTQPATVQDFVIEADSVSLMVQGNINFTLGGQTWFALSGTFDAIFQDPNNQPQLDILLDAYLDIGPSTAPIVQFDANGFLQLWSGGIAATINVTFDSSASSVLEKAGIDLTAPIDPLTGKPVKNQFTLDLNTSSTEVKFMAPVLTTSDPNLTPPAAGTTIDIPAGPPSADGTASAAGPYMEIVASGGFELDNAFAVIGSFNLVVTTSQFMAQLDAQLFVQTQGSTLLNLQAIGGIDISSQGIYGAMQLTLNAGLPAGYGFSLNASFMLEVNTTNQMPKIAGITLPPGPFVEVDATGDLIVGPIDISGSFDFTASSSVVEISANGMVTLGPLGTLDVSGDIKILAPEGSQQGGLVGIIQTNIATGTTLSSTGFDFNAHFEFEINTTNIAQPVTGFVAEQINGGYTGNVVQNQTIMVQPGVMLDIGGSLSLVNVINIAGDFDVTITPTSLQITLNAQLSGFLGVNIAINNAQFAIFGDDNQGPGGIVIEIPLSFSAGLGTQLFSISANPVFIVNTSPVPRLGIGPSHYELQLNNANVSILGFTLSGSVDAEYSNGVFMLDVPQSNPLSLSFFSIGQASVYGYLSSTGQFSLTGSVGFDLDDGHGDSLYGSFSITISNQGFSATVAAGATVFGINLASVYGTVDIEGTGVYLAASVYVLGIGFSFNIQFGTIGAAHPPNQIYWYSVPTQGPEGGQIQLDAGASDSNGNTVSNYTWTITGPYGFDEILSGANPTLMLGAPGTYAVSLAAGSGLTETSTIVAQDVAPVLNSVGSLVAYAVGVQQTITPSITAPLPSEQDGGGLKYNWSLTRNGASYAPAGVNLSNSTLVFTPPPLADTMGGSPDIYTATLTVKDNWGGVATASSTFSTGDPANDVVQNTNDTGPGSLRAAIDIQYTSESSGFFSIRFAPSLAYHTITLTSSDDTVDHGNSALKIAPNEFIDIDATDVPGITITAAQSQPGYGPTQRLIYVGENSILRLQGLTLEGGIAYGNEDQATGGAVYVDSYATLGLEDCTIIDNEAVGNLGSINPGPGHAGNVYGADGRGGAIFINTNGNLFAADDTFADNSAQGAYGIGPVVYGYGVVTYFGGGGYGGAIANYGGGMILIGDTIAANSVTSGGGAFPGPAAAGAGVVESNNALSIIYNTIIANNTGAADYNPLSRVNATGSNDIIANPGPGTPSGYASMPFNPLLGPIANHGDGRLTYSLLPGSPALGAGNPNETFSEQFDGRGMPRLNSTGKVDIGAFEHQPYFVSNTNDSGPGSLRAAVAYDDDESPIYFSPNLAGQTIMLTSGPIAIAGNITLTGPGANQLEIESAAGATTPATPVNLYSANGNANDSGGSANGTVMGGVSFVTGKVGAAFQFNGTNGYIAVPPSADVTGSGAFTVAAWIKTSSDGVIIQQRDASNFNGEYVLAVISGKINFWDFGNSEYGFNMTSNATVADGNWHYIVAVRQANGAGQIYIDGQLDSSQSGNIVPTASNVNVYIGADLRNVYFGDPPEYFNGLIDEVAIYHSALTAAQIDQSYSIANGGRVFVVEPGATFTLVGLTVAGGVNAAGGGIYNAGNLTVINSVLSSDVAQAAPGGYAADAFGGAIYNGSGASLTVTGSTFFNDSAIGWAGYTPGVTGVDGSGRGGAIYSAASGLLELTNDTFSDNTATVAGPTPFGLAGPYGAFGGSIDNAGSAYIVNTTIAHGSVDAPVIPGGDVDDGAGIENDAGAKLAMFNTIVADDSGGNDVANLGALLGSNNLVMTSVGVPTGVVALTSDPQLQLLAYNGGTTPTLALSPTSPAVGAGSTSAILPPVLPTPADLWLADGTALDSAGSARGTLQGSPGSVTFATGVEGQAFQFNGTNGYIAIPPSADIVGTGAFTVSAWIKSTSNGVIIQQRDASNFNGEYVVAIVGGKINFWDFGNSEYGFDMFSNETVTDGNWHFIVAVREANGTGQIYIDGLLDSSQAGNVVPAGSNVNIYIGADIRILYYGSNPEYFNGLIDDVAIYTSAVSASAVLESYVLGPAQQVSNGSGGGPTVSGLVGWWSGNGTASASTGNDSGTATSSVSYVQGQVGQAFQLNGQNDEVNIPDNAPLDTSTFSIAGWFDLTAAPAGGSEYYLASKYDGAYHGWILRVNSSLVPAISIEASPNAYVNATSSAALSLNTWYFIAATYNGSTATLYVNGTGVAAATFAGSYSPSAGSLVLGAASWFNGGYASTLIDEFTYYDRALAASEVQAVYLFGPSQLPAVSYPAAAPSGVNGLVGWWSGNGSALDSTGRDSGTTNSGVTYAAGTSGEAFQLDGQTGEVAIPDNAALDTSGFSFGGWFELTQAPPAGGEVFLATKYGGNYNGWILRVNSSFTLTLSLSKSPTSSSNTVANKPLALNTWYYIAATYDGNAVNLYVNGVLAGSTTLANGYAPSPTPLVLGASSWASYGYAKALIDEFTFYDRALTPGEIQSLYSYAGGQPTVDQRGFSDVVNGTVDIGSYQVQPYVVTNTNDSGPGSLRQAVLDDVSGDEPIDFAPGLDGQIITLASPILISHNVTITGPGASMLTISGGGTTEVFEIKAGTVSISGVTISGGFSTQGGAVDNAGSLSASAVIFSNDVAQGTTSNPNAYGGAIYNEPGAILTIIDSTLNNDSAIASAGGAAAGGAIDNVGGTMTLTDDTFTANLAEGGASGVGGAIDNASTFNPDGSVNQSGTANIVNTTIAANTLLASGGTPPAAPTNGAGVQNEVGASLLLENSIVANDVGGLDVANLGTITGDSNMVPTSTGLPNGVVEFTANPLLDALQYNGGPTPSIAPAGQSMALDNGNNLFATTLTDQDGNPRVRGGQIDIGAVEYNGPTHVLNTNDSGTDSLRHAIATAALYPNSIVIFDRSLAGKTIALSSEILIEHNVVIDASATPGIVISGANLTRLFEIAPGVTVTLRGLTIENGNASSGGAVLNDGTFTLDSTTFTKNTVTGNGGAVENDGTLTVIDSTIAGNFATSDGGAIDNNAILTLIDSTIAENTAASGGGVFAARGVTSAVDTIIAANTASDGKSDFVGTLTTLGNNLIGTAKGAHGLTSSDKIVTNPKLGPLQNNGGPTPTMDLLAGSPAIDNGTSTSAPAHDQRGLPRIVGGAIDIGAFELQNTAPLAKAGGPYTVRQGSSLTLNASASTDQDGDRLTYSWDINGDGTFRDATGPKPTLSWAQLTALGLHPQSTPYEIRVQVSDGFGPTHVVTSLPVKLTVLPHLQVTNLATVTGGPRTPVNSVTVTFGGPIKASSFATKALTLTRNGGANLIKKRVSIVPVDGSPNTYRIEGLAALTRSDGRYVLPINLADLADSFGPGSGASTVAWLLDTTPPMRKLSPRGPAGPLGLGRFQ